MNIQKCQTNGSQASTDQLYSTSTHQLYRTRAVGLMYHRFAANAQTICATHEHTLQSRKSWTEIGLPELAAALPLHQHACSRLQLPSYPYPDFIRSCGATVGCFAIVFSKAQDPEHIYCSERPNRVTFSNKEIKLILQILTFYQGSCNVCCSCR